MSDKNFGDLNGPGDFLPGEPLPDRTIKKELLSEADRNKALKLLSCVEFSLWANEPELMENWRNLQMKLLEGATPIERSKIMTTFETLSENFGVKKDENGLPLN